MNQVALFIGVDSIAGRPSSEADGNGAVDDFVPGNKKSDEEAEARDYTEG